MVHCCPAHVTAREDSIRSRNARLRTEVLDIIASAKSN